MNQTQRKYAMEKLQDTVEDMKNNIRPVKPETSSNSDILKVIHNGKLSSLVINKNVDPNEWRLSINDVFSTKEDVKLLKKYNKEWEDYKNKCEIMDKVLSEAEDELMLGTSGLLVLKNFKKDLEDAIK